MKAEGGRDDRGWDGWMTSLTLWTWVWAISGIWWWTGKAGMLRFMGLQRVRHDWATVLNWKYVWKGIQKYNFRWLPLKKVCFEMEQVFCNLWKMSSNPVTVTKELCELRPFPTFLNIIYNINDQSIGFISSSLLRQKILVEIHQTATKFLKIKHC